MASCPIAIPAASHPSSSSSSSSESTTPHSPELSRVAPPPVPSSSLFAHSLLTHTTAPSSSSSSSSSSTTSTSPPRGHFRSEQVLKAAGISPDDKVVWECKGDEGGLRLRREVSWNDAKAGVGGGALAESSPEDVIRVSPTAVYSAPLESTPTLPGASSFFRRRSVSEVDAGCFPEE